MRSSSPWLKAQITSIVSASMAVSTAVVTGREIMQFVISVFLLGNKFPGHLESKHDEYCIFLCELDEYNIFLCELFSVYEKVSFSLDLAGFFRNIIIFIMISTDVH